MTVFGNAADFPHSNRADYYMNYVLAGTLLLHLVVSTVLNPIVFYYHYKYVKRASPQASQQ